MNNPTSTPEEPIKDFCPKDSVSPSGYFFYIEYMGR
jgi:hypothetical protein